MNSCENPIRLYKNDDVTVGPTLNVDYDATVGPI